MSLSLGSLSLPPHGTHLGREDVFVALQVVAALLQLPAQGAQLLVARQQAQRVGQRGTQRLLPALRGGARQRRGQGRGGGKEGQAGAKQREGATWRAAGAPPGGRTSGDGCAKAAAAARSRCGRATS